MYTDISLNPGVSANADPHTKKFRARVARIWGDRKVQPIRSAMERPHPGGTPLLIRVPSAPGKYDLAYAASILIVTPTKKTQGF